MSMQSGNNFNASPVVRPTSFLYAHMQMLKYAKAYCLRFRLTSPCEPFEDPILLQNKAE